MEKKDSDSIKSKICKQWKFATKEYKLMKVLGAGTFGQVIHSKHRKTK